MTASARRTRAETTAQTRRDLIATAERRFLRDGYHATTVDDIADEAGYTKGAVYSTYGSKAGLFLALYDEIVDRRLAQIGALLDARESTEARLHALARRAVDESDAQFLLLAIEFWVHAARDPALLLAFSQRHRRLRLSLAQLAPPSSPLGADDWAIVTLALSHGLALERLIDPDGVADDLMAAVQTRILRPDAA